MSPPAAGPAPSRLQQPPGPQNEKPSGKPEGFVFNSGDVLLSHTLARAVPSGLKGLTSVFGMGTGVTPSLQSPKRSYEERILTGFSALDTLCPW